MNSDEIQHVATCVLLNMAERSERIAADLLVVAGEPRDCAPGFAGRSPEQRERIRTWQRISWHRSIAKNYREMAAQPEKEEFDRLRKNFEHETELRGAALRIGDAQPPLGEAIATLKKVTSIVSALPVTHGPQPSPEARVPPRASRWDL